MNLASFGGPALALRTHVTKRVEAMTPRQRKASRALSMASLVALTSLVTAEPAFAQTNWRALAMRSSAC
jgi:type IV secretion system protein VirB2